MKKATALCTDHKELVILGWIITMKGHLPHLTTAIFSIVMTRKKKNIAEHDSKEESEDEEHETSENGEDYDPWKTLIHEAKLQLLDKFQENVECLNYEGFSEVEAKRQSFSELLPKLTKELEGIYVDRLLWMSHMKKYPIHKKIMQTRDNLIDVDFLDREEALYSAVEKREFLFKRLLEKRQHSDDESDTME
jgi:hypothetical protein